MYQYQYPVPTIGPTAIRRSKGLIALGGILGALSAFLFIFCFIFIFEDYFMHVYLLGLITAVYHIICSILVIVGGINIEKYRCCVTATLAMGIVGSVVFIVTMLTVDIITWSKVDSDCEYGCNNQEYYYCPRICGNTTSRFLTILLVSFVVGVVDIVASSITCCNVCSCCCCYDGPSNSGIVVSQPQNAYGSIQNQVQTQYPPPHYYSVINPQTGANQPTGANPSMGQNTSGRNNQRQNQQIHTESEVNDYQVNHDDHARILSSNM